MCRSARFSCIAGGLALMFAACGMEESSENRGPLDIPRGLGKADSAFSCKGHCGGKAPGCYCDSQCEQYGDCCPDKAKECDGSTTKICGGIAGIQCPAGEKCKLDGTYPDASGKCVPENYCDTPADCSGLIHPMCVGQWQCVSNTCSYKCGPPPPPPCSQLQELACNARTDCEWKTTPGFPGPISMCVEKQPSNKCGPFPGGQCDPGYVCDIQSCGLGASGTCVPLPKCDPYFKDPVCGCDGTTYNNDCMRRAAGAALDHKGACGSTPKPCYTNGDCAAKEFCALKPGECLLPTFTILGGTCAPKPEACIQLYDPVCGCDNKTYGNACMAASKGVNVASKGACKPTPTSYCKGFCGGKSSHSCYCDAQCDKYGDCCPDVKQACPNL